MSTAELTNDTRPVLQQIGERAAEQSPAWGMPRMGMTQSLLANQEDARRRVHESFRRECIAAGRPDPGEFEPMGDFSVQGDTTTVNHHYPPPQPAHTPVSTSTTSTVTRTGGLRGFVTAALIGASSLGAGAAGMALYNWATDKPEAVTNITQPIKPTDWRLGIEVKDQP